MPNSKGLPGEEIEAPLPTDRVTPLRPFAVTGIDYAGPLFVEVGGTLKKCYIALLTCATTRAVYLEFCLYLSADRFPVALQRFQEDVVYLTKFTPITPRRSTL